MRLDKSKFANVNYLAKVVKIDEFQAHPDPEVNKLKCCTIDGFNIICGIDSQPGLYVYFPASCCLNPQLLSYANLYRHANLNNNPNETGMFEDNGRVKAIKLRGCISEGFILPITILENFIMSVTNKEVEYSVNTEFDCVKEGDKEFWINKKYIVNTIRTVSSNEPREGKGRKNKKKFNKVIDEQFRFHYDTVIIKKCPNVIKPEDLIHISSKVHGTSAISAYVLCKKKPRWYDCIFKFLAEHTCDLHWNPTYYDYLYSSRTRVLNGVHDSEIKDGYYSGDALMRKMAHEVIVPHLDKGMTVYYEILGFLPTGAYVQKNYDYGYNPPIGDEKYEFGKHFGIRVYRVTLTNTDGKVHEFSPREVQIWCKNKGLAPVDEYYYGIARDLYPELDKDIHWSDNFINKLADETKFNMEKDSPECNNVVPHEGIVIKKDNMRSEAFKLKCFKFLNKEQKELDKGEANIEDEA